MTPEEARWKYGNHESGYVSCFNCPLFHTDTPLNRDRFCPHPCNGRNDAWEAISKYFTEKNRRVLIARNGSYLKFIERYITTDVKEIKSMANYLSDGNKKMTFEEEISRRMNRSIHTSELKYWHCHCGRNDIIGKTERIDYDPTGDGVTATIRLLRHNDGFNATGYFHDDYIKKHIVPEPTFLIPKIKRVIFNDPATIVLWEDGTKTVVKCGEHDTFDPEKGLAMAISKKTLGNNYSYYDYIRRFLPKDYKVNKEKEVTLTGTFECGDSLINQVCPESCDGPVTVTFKTDDPT